MTRRILDALAVTASIVAFALFSALIVYAYMNGAQ